MRRATIAFLLLAGLLAARAEARPKPAPPPAATCRLEVQVRSSEPMKYCEIALERDGAVLRHGRPDAGGVLAFADLPPGRYDVRATARSFVPRGERRAGAMRSQVWMRNGEAHGHAKLKPARDGKPKRVTLHLHWGPKLAAVMVE